MPSHSLVPNNLKRIYKLASRRNVETIPALWGGICAGGVMRIAQKPWSTPVDFEII